MAAQEPDMLWREFAGELLQEMLGAVTRTAGRSWKVSSIHSHFDESRSELVWLCLVFSGSIDGNCMLGFSKADVAVLSAGAGSVQKQKAREEDCLAEAFAAVAPELSEAARKSYGSFTFSVTAQSQPPLHDHSALTIQLHDDRSRAINVVVYAAPGLLERLIQSARSKEGEASDPVDSAGISSEALFARAPNLDLLMDVELDVTLRFGQRHLTLREVLDLTSGSVVELDRQVEEPVELILDGRVIARGEAVVVDGNYGLRVTEVPQPLVSRQLRA